MRLQAGELRSVRPHTRFTTAVNSHGETGATPSFFREEAKTRRCDPIESTPRESDFRFPAVLLSSHCFGTTMISTRRFFSRPSAVSFVAIGLVAP